MGTDWYFPDFHFCIYVKSCNIGEKSLQNWRPSSYFVKFKVLIPLKGFIHKFRIGSNFEFLDTPLPFHAIERFLMINGKVMPKCTSFKYLGSAVNTTTTRYENVNHRISVGCLQILVTWSPMATKFRSTVRQVCATKITRIFRIFARCT